MPHQVAAGLETMHLPKVFGTSVYTMLIHRLTSVSQIVSLVVSITQLFYFLSETIRHTHTIEVNIYRKVIKY